MEVLTANEAIQPEEEMPRPWTSRLSGKIRPVLPKSRQAGRLYARHRACAEMKRIIDTSEVLGTVAAPEGTCELCAAAVAGFDEAAGRLVVELEAYLRPAGFLAKERHFRADWLPANETVTESVAREESGAVAREIFHRWVRRVRDSAPALHHV